jgi:hypothetical protein
VYDDLDPSFVAFPNKTGILYSSNRPSAQAGTSDDSLPGKHFNIYLIDNWNKSEFKQISKLSDLRYGNARHPSQYNQSHFTFTSDENGVNNRYAGFFRTERAGLDTLVFIGDEVLRNPPQKDIDSLLKEWKKTDIDSLGFVSFTNDSSYVFPLTNYQSSLLETRTAGDNQQVSEVVKLGDIKLLYRLRVDENTLKRRNITARPTEYIKKVIEEEKKAAFKTTTYQPKTDTLNKKQNDFFNSGFNEEKTDSNKLGQVVTSEVIKKEPVLKKAKVYEYRPPKFFNDYLVSGLNNNVLVTRLQPYGGPPQSPIQLSNGDFLNGLIRLGISDLFEDWKIAGGFRITTDLNNKEYIFSTQYLKKRIDYGITYYRNTLKVIQVFNGGSASGYLSKEFSNLYQGTVTYPFNKIQSLRLNVAARRDKYVVLTDNSDPNTLTIPDRKITTLLGHLEFIHDDAISPATNIWNGLRGKIYFDVNEELRNTFGTTVNKNHPVTFNAGFDVRHYLPIYRNVIWAVRAAGDFSWGKQKIIYYLGGVDNWLMFGKNQKIDKNGNVSYRFLNPANIPDPNANYSFQSLAVNLRGFLQNTANGNNAMVINSEIRAPVFSSFFNKPINNAFLRNLQVVQFIDLGTAWNGKYNKIARPTVNYNAPPVSVKIKAGGIGPFAGGYGFGARSTLFGYFLRFDAAWQMNRFFGGRPKYYFAMGLDF